MGGYGGVISPVPYRSSCGAGAQFEADAYTLVASDCALADHTFTHEIGHLMGGNHARSQLSPAWVNAVVGNGYPEAFAKMVYLVFESVMSINQYVPRRLYFSNPDVIADGVATGNPGTENNARVIRLLAPAMEDFRMRPELIFANGFQ